MNVYNKENNKTIKMELDLIVENLYYDKIELINKEDKDKKPIVSVVSRDQRDLVKIFKAFYLKYPHLKWITFRDMRGLPREVFAKELSESCVAVWVDDVAGFGTFPIEAMKSGVPVIAKVPNMVPEYFTDKNGLWSHDLRTIPDLIANYVQAWLEDGEPSELYEEMSKLNNSHSVEDMKQKISELINESE